MFIDEIREFCLEKAEVSEHFPFDETTLVFKVSGKMFALIDIHQADSISLKCNPDYAIQLREEFPEIQGGYHLNKRLWNTVSLTGNISKEMIKELISHSYREVVLGLKKADRERLLHAE